MSGGESNFSGSTLARHVISRQIDINRLLFPELLLHSAVGVSVRRLVDSTRKQIEFFLSPSLQQPKRMFTSK
jgi:hypothetical protein